MPIFSDTNSTTFPSFTGFKTVTKPSLHININPDDAFDEDLEDILTSGGKMAGTGSPTPFIKDEPEDQFNSNRFIGANGFDMTHQFGGQGFGNTRTDIGGVNPSDLTSSGSFMNTQFGSHNMSSSFMMGNGGLGNSGIADDELLDLGNLDDPSNHHGTYNDFGDQGNIHQGGQQGYFPDSVHGGSVSISNAGNHMNQIYSHTPEGAPIQSPFVHGFDYGHFQSMNAQRPGFPNSVPSNAGIPSGSFAMRNKMQRQASDSRSPLTPKTPALGAGLLGTPDSGSFPTQPIMANSMGHRQQKSMSSQWDHTPGSGHSWVDSPLPSPNGGPIHHQQISEVLQTGKHQSLPAKVDAGLSASVPSIQQTQEIKRRRRRESHNMVERRRRDNINERIQDLSRLVPQHRLEDEKVRKHIHNNGPLSPSIAANGMSPPHATSLLAGGSGRRAAGNITTGLPIEDKDKGPNKGDILNGAVSWTRDLMWALYQKIRQVDELKAAVEQLGGECSSEETEDERRMRTELIDAVERNHVDNFRYSRGPGSGLRVPKHTNVAGEPLNPMSPQSLSPGMQSGGSGANSGGNGQPQFWMNQHSGSSGHGSFSLKEEDEFGMDMS